MKNIQTYDEFINENYNEINESFLSDVISYGIIGLILYGIESIPGIIEDYKMSRQEKAELKYLYERYHSLFVGDSLLKRLVSDYEKLDKQYHAEYDILKKAWDDNPFKKGSFMSMDDPKSWQPRMDALTAIGSHIESVIKDKLGVAEVNDRDFKKTLTSLRKAMINSIHTI